MAVVYRRVSSDGQAGERHVSLEVQQARTEAYVRGKGYVLDQVFTDVASGRKDSRREYQRMLDFVRKGGASVIITQFLDRFGRNPREILRRVWELEELGVRVECSDEDISQEMVLLIRSGMAGAESKRIGERVRHTIRRAVERGGVKPGIAPFGYRAVKKVDDRGKVLTVFEQDPREVAIIREMFDMRATRNMGLKVIADALNAAGHRTRRGVMFSPESIKVILQNPCLVGRFEYGRWQRRNPVNEPLPVVRVEKAFPAILSSQEWDALQQRMRIRREESMKHGRVNLSSYLLSGILRCGYCGAAMSGSTAGNRYYVCGNAVKSKVRCPDSKYTRADALEKAVLDELDHYADPIEARKRMGKVDGERLRRLQAEQDAIDKRLAQAERTLKTALSALAAGALDQEQFGRLSREEREGRATLMERRAQLESELSEAKNNRQIAMEQPAKVRAFREAFPHLEPRLQKARLQEILKAVHVTRDGIQLEGR